MAEIIAKPVVEILAAQVAAVLVVVHQVMLAAMELQVKVMQVVAEQILPAATVVVEVAEQEQRAVPALVPLEEMVV